MFAPLAVILLAVAVGTVGVIRRPRRAAEPVPAGDLEQIKGFVYVGAGALVLLVVAVVIVGSASGGSGVAEGIAILGFVAYLVYLLAAFVITYWSTWRHHRRLDVGKRLS